MDEWKWIKHWSFWVVLIVGIILTWFYFQEPGNAKPLGDPKIIYPDIAITFDFSKNERRWRKEQGYKVSHKYLTDRRKKND